MKTCLVQYADIYWDMGRYPQRPPSSPETPKVLCTVRSYTHHLLIAFGANRLFFQPKYNLVAAEFPEELDTTKLVQIKVILACSDNPGEPKQLILNCLDSEKSFPELANGLNGLAPQYQFKLQQQFQFSKVRQEASKSFLRTRLAVDL